MKDAAQNVTEIY